MTDTTDRQLFHDWLAGHARGLLDSEITAALGEVVEAVTHLEKSGKVVVELTVEPAGSGGRTVMVAGVVKTKPPLPAPEASIFFAGDGGSLHRDDPYQQRAFDRETGEIQ